MATFSSTHRSRTHRVRSWFWVAWTICVFLQPVLARTPEAPLRLDRLEHLTHSDGMSHDWVIDLLQDRQGFLWIGTSDGLDRYDGYRFQNYRHDPEDPDSLSNNFIREIHEDRDGALWIGTRGGLNRLDPRTGDILRFRGYEGSDSGLRGESISDIGEDRDGFLWIATEDDVDRLDPGSLRFEALETLNDEAGEAIEFAEFLRDSEERFWAANESLCRLDDADDSTAAAAWTCFELAFVDDLQRTLWNFKQDAAGDFWLAYTSGELLRFDPRTATSAVVSLQAPGAPSPGWLNSLLPRSDGSLWIGTERSGLVVLGPETGEAQAFLHKPGEPGSLSNNRVMKIVEDRAGILWFGTDTGLNKFVPKREAFLPIQHQASDSNSLSGNFVWPIEIDSLGFAWVGTVGHGLNRLDLRPTKPKSQRFSKSSDDPNSLRSEVIASLFIDREDSVWVGHESGVDLYSPAEERFRPLPTIVEDPADELEGLIRAIVSGDDVVWIAGDDGLWRYEPTSKKLRRFRHDPEDPQSLADNTIYVLLSDGERLWNGTSAAGLGRFDLKTETFEYFVHDPTDPLSIADDSVTALHRDRSDRLWIGTSGGFARFDEETVRFVHLRRGFPNQNTVGIEEADDGRLWIATYGGLVRFDPETGATKTFDSGDGMLEDALAFQSSAILPDGRLMFGTHSGLNLFDPDRLTSDPAPPEVVIADFQILNESVPLAARRKPKLMLDHREKIFSFEFSALHFASPKKNRYAYRLEGFQDDWVETDARNRRAQYTNLDPGEYVFRVKATNPDGVWNEEGVAVPLEVLAPPWKTWWAKTLYLLGALGLVGLFVRSQRIEVQRQQEAAAYEREAAERERQINRRLREVDKLKDEFLANTSHELRTPLYGMTGLAESLIDGARGELPHKAQQDLAMIVASGRRLSGLVNDILDFAKLRNEGLELHLRPIDLCSLTEVVLALSRPLAQAKGLTLTNSVEESLPAVNADENRLQQILHNLVGNAIKFTESGSVTIDAEILPDRDRIRVRVRDTGVGIPEDRQAAIFKAFEQADASIERRFGGTGLGLAITTELVELHGGTIDVVSQEDEGSTFSFTLHAAEGEADPLEQNQEDPPSLKIDLEDLNQWADEPSAAKAFDENALEALPDLAPAEEARILIVDDEPVNRRILNNQLTSQGYGAVRAASGPEALDLVAQETPDLILLDVMMPKMSGYEVCRKLREDYTLEELPIIFLTAKSRVEDLVVGLAAGANDYLAKPIAKNELLSRVKTHLNLLHIHRQVNRLLEARTSELGEREWLLHERKKLIDDLEARNAELARFNYTVSHDLKNPLVTIKNFLGMLRQDTEKGHSERLETHLEHLENASEHMSQMVEELFEYSSLGVRSNTAGPVDLGAVVDEVLAESAERLQARRVQVEISDDLPTVLGDPPRLRELVVHLIDNAQRFLGDEKLPRIEIGALPDGLSIRDNGIGIEAAYHGKIFELFEQLGPREGRHTGIGLALVKRIAEVHGGRAWVESDGLGHGSTFYVSFGAKQVSRSSN